MFRFFPAENMSFLCNIVTSLMMIRMSCGDLDSEDMYMQVRRNLIANTDTVANQIKEREDLENTKKKRERLLDSQHLLRPSLKLERLLTFSSPEIHLQFHTI